jgi:hypothetical protein
MRNFQNARSRTGFSLGTQKIENGQASGKLADNQVGTNGATARCRFHAETMAGSGCKVKRGGNRDFDFGKLFSDFLEKSDGIPQMGDAVDTKAGYLCVNLGDKERIPGCLLRPTRHLGKSRPPSNRTLRVGDVHLGAPIFLCAFTNIGDAAVHPLP